MSFQFFCVSIPKPENLPRFFGATLWIATSKGRWNENPNIVEFSTNMQALRVVNSFCYAPSRVIVEVVLLNNQMNHWLGHCQSVVVPHSRLKST